MYNPYFLIYDVGFLLSFSAVLGIIFIDVFKKESKDKKLDSDSNKTKSE